MILINKTKIPDKVLQKVLMYALRRAEARTKRALVEVRLSRVNRLSGEAFRGDSHKVGDKWHFVDGGVFTIWICLNGFPVGDKLQLAQDFYTLAVHEAKHVADFQRGLEFAGPINNNRRANWKDRPEEIRANFTQNMAKRDLELGQVPMGLQDALIGLAVELERIIV